MHFYRLSEKSRLFYRSIQAFSIRLAGSSSTTETTLHRKAKSRFLYVLNLLKYMYRRFPYKTFVFNTSEKIIPPLIILAMITEKGVPSIESRVNFVQWQRWFELWSCLSQIMATPTVWNKLLCNTICYISLLRMWRLFFNQWQAAVSVHEVVGGSTSSQNTRLI